MNKGLKTVIWLVVIVAVVWLISGVVKTAPGQQGENSDVIKIGSIAPMAGDAAVYGEPAVNVYKIAVDEINAAGGINGKQVQLIAEDGKCNGEGATSAAQKLVNVDKVQVIIGGFCSAESLAAITVAEAGKVALFSPGSSSPDLTGKSAYFFRNFPSDSTQGGVLAQVAYDLGKRKVAFLQEQTDYTLGIYNAFKVKFESLGGTVVKEEYPSTTKDFRSSLTKLRASNADALFIDANTPASIENILQQLTVLKWKPTLFANDVLIGAAAIVEKYKSQLEGMYGAEFGVNPNNEKFKHLVKTYKAKYGVDIPYPSYAQTEYDAIYMIKDAITEVGYDGTKLAAWGHAVTDWQGASGLVTIGSNGDRASGHNVEIVKDGKVVPYTK